MFWYSRRSETNLYERPEHKFPHKLDPYGEREISWIRYLYLLLPSITMIGLMKCTMSHYWTRPYLVLPWRDILFMWEKHLNCLFLFKSPFFTKIQIYYNVSPQINCSIWWGLPSCQLVLLFPAEEQSIFLFSSSIIMQQILFYFNMHNQKHIINFYIFFSQK